MPHDEDSREPANSTRNQLRKARIARHGETHADLPGPSTRVVKQTQLPDPERGSPPKKISRRGAY